MSLQARPKAAYIILLYFILWDSLGWKSVTSPHSPNKLPWHKEELNLGLPDYRSDILNHYSVLVL